jgi:ATP-dependent RNA helicase RhlE
MTALLPTMPTAAPTFAALGLSAALAQGAAAAGWRQATPIQALAIPAILQGRDVLGAAPTGSGKTAAFLLPLLQRLLAEPGLAEQRPRPLRALVLAPTRELAAQIEAAARALAPQLKVMLAIGGMAINPQMMALRGGAHLVVATPGRLLDLVERRALSLNALALLVLDEADRLLDLGFADEVGRVIALCPVRRQTLLFSATLPAAVSGLAATVLRDPVRLDAAAAPAAADAALGAESETAAVPAPQPDIVQRAIEVDTAQRTPLLRHLIASEGWPRVLVFVATQYASEHVADKLARAGIAAAALHGQLSPGRRRRVLVEFAQRRLTVLVATDLAARGLDVAGLEVVVNHDLPRSAPDYIHRIGRSGRAGARGLAVSLVCADAPGSEAHFRLIEKRQQQRVPREQVAGFEPAAAPAAAVAADPTGGVKGRRKSRKDKLREAAAAAAKKATPR